MNWTYPPLLHKRWIYMMTRCRSPSAGNYAYYGGRGIKVCLAWRIINEHNDGRKNFIIWALANAFHPDLTLDRIDNDGDYSPKNCRWVTRSVQQKNKRRALAS